LAFFENPNQLPFEIARNPIGFMTLGERGSHAFKNKSNEFIIAIVWKF
jgi:hypothetical protein